MNLDCRDLETTIESLRTAMGISENELVHALHSYDASRLADHLYDDVAKAICASFGLEPEELRFSGASFFHGTRAISPSQFMERGVLTLPEMLDEIWAQLGDLSGVAASDWALLRKDVEGEGGEDAGWRYRGRIEHRVNHGPNAYLIREMHLMALDSHHDYLGCPEIVQDICTCCHAATGVDLERIFVSQTTPCIVRFERPEPSTQNVETAFAYAFAVATSTDLGGIACGGGFDGYGVSVPPEFVAAVEAIEAPAYES